MNYNYERDQQRSLRLLEEVPTDDDFDDEEKTTENDVVEERSEDNDTEKKIEENEMDTEAVCKVTYQNMIQRNARDVIAQLSVFRRYIKEMIQYEDGRMWTGCL
ncbi:hypothetical protein JTB14_031581 [Gonioctena quinquepunctata]|nr:hypothetical protein JTB14_031581 [Gonioctena quinquepunctata]